MEPETEPRISPLAAILTAISIVVMLYYVAHSLLVVARGIVPGS